jgi:hypothetical protein
MENAVFRKDFNLCATSSLFHVFTHMDYNMGSTFFVMISFQYFFIGTQYFIHDGKKNMD